MAADRGTPAGGRLLVRSQRHQRARPAGAGARRGHGVPGGGARAAAGGPAVPAVGQDGERPARPGPAAGRLRDRAPRGGARRPGVLAGDQPGHPGQPRGGRRRGPRGAAGRPDGARRPGDRGQPGHRRAGPWRTGLPLHRPGQPAGGHGTGVGRDLRGLRGGFRGGLLRTRPPPLGTPGALGAGRRLRRAGHRAVRAAEPDGLHPGRALRGRGRPLPTGRILRPAARLRGRPLDRRAGGGARRWCLLAGRRRRAGRRSGPADAGAARGRRDDRGAGHGGGRHPVPDRPGRRGGGQRPQLGGDLGRRGPGAGDRGPARGPRLQDQATAGQPRLPLAADGRDAGGVPRGRLGPGLPAADDPDRLDADRHPGPAGRAALGRLLGPARAAAGPLPGGRAHPAEQGRQHLHRGRPGRRADGDGPGDAGRRDRERTLGAAAAPQPARAEHPARFARPGARARRAGGLDRAARRGRAPGGPADLRLPAPAVLGGRGQAGRRRGGSRTDRGRSPAALRDDGTAGVGRGAGDQSALAEVAPVAGGPRGLRRGPGAGHGAAGAGRPGR